MKITKNAFWKWKVWNFPIVKPTELIGKVGSTNRSKRGSAVYPGEYPYQFYQTIAKIFVDEDDIVLHIWANVLKVSFILFILTILVLQ
jgi:hypothetical protein